MGWLLSGLNVAQRRRVSTAIVEQGWFSRLRAFFGLSSRKGTTSTLVSSNSTAKSSSISPLRQQSLKMHTSTLQAVAARIPMIKFVGARLPRPSFDRASLPSLQITGNMSAGPLVAAKPTSIGAVGKIPRGQGIPESQLPKKFRRQPISQEECDAINNGGAYGL